MDVTKKVANRLIVDNTPLVEKLMEIEREAVSRSDMNLVQQRVYLHNVEQGMRAAIDKIRGAGFMILEQH
jgi:hypothetical protein